MDDGKLVQEESVGQERKERHDLLAVTQVPSSGREYTIWSRGIGDLGLSERAVQACVQIGVSRANDAHGDANPFPKRPRRHAPDGPLRNVC